MSSQDKQDWNPETYARFRGLRLRPALDLLAQVPALPEGGVVDLGCGAGAVAGALKTRFPDHPLIGVDSSPAMLEQAEETGLYDHLALVDASDWTPERPPALIFSNALCHWLPAHDQLFTRLAHAVAAGGCLAVQMPRQYSEPSHAALRALAAQMFPDRFDFSDWAPPVAAPETYQTLLAPLGRVNVWESVFYQSLEPSVDAHPVRRFTESTAVRPFVAQLTAPELERFLAAYDAALLQDYPLSLGGGVIMPFRRLFFTLTRLDQPDV